METFLASGGDWPFLAFLGLHQNPSNCCHCHHMGLFSLAVSDSSDKDTVVLDEGAHSTPVLGVRTLTFLRGRTQFNP